ncbi:MAG: aldo/keto reductase [Bacteroidetes bacterium]|nr:aldo/keto reductase [Bacteroidota bacterium]
MLISKPIGKTSQTSTIFGLGGTGVANMYSPTNRKTAFDTMHTAWDLGVRYFDMAPLYGYGLSERRMGDFLRNKPRNEFVLSTKVGRILKPGTRNSQTDIYAASNMPFYVEYDYTYDGAMRSFEDSLQRLGMDKIDILFIHDIGVDTHPPETQPGIFKTAMEGAYKALDKLRSEGVISGIGLGVNEWRVCEKATEYGDFDCFLLAGRFTLLEQTALETFLPMCLEKNISVVVGGVFNSGLLIDPYMPEPMYNYEPAPLEMIERAKTIDAICRKHQVPMTAAALQYPLTHPAVCSVLSGCRSGQEVREVIDWMEMDIPVGLWEELKMESFILS